MMPNEELKKYAATAYRELARFKIPEQFLKVAYVVIGLSYEEGYEEAIVQRRYLVGEATRIIPGNLTKVIRGMRTCRMLQAYQDDGGDWILRFLIQPREWGFPSIFLPEEDEASRQAMAVMRQYVRARADATQTTLFDPAAVGSVCKPVGDHLIAASTEFPNALADGAREEALGDWEAEQARESSVQNAPPEQPPALDSVVRRTTNERLKAQVVRGTTDEPDGVLPGKLYGVQPPPHEHEACSSASQNHEHDHVHVPGGGEWEVDRLTPAQRDLLGQVEELTRPEGLIAKFRTTWLMRISQNPVQVAIAIGNTRLAVTEGRINTTIGGTLNWEYEFACKSAGKPFGTKARDLMRKVRGALHL